MYLMSLKVWNIVVLTCQCTNNCRRKKILFHFRWWVRVALKRKVATGTNINPIHFSTFHVKYLHGIRCANPLWNSIEYPIPANFFWDISVRFLSWECWNFWRQHDHFQRFPKKSEVFWRRPKSFDDVQSLPKASSLPVLFTSKSRDFSHFFNQAWEIGPQAWAGVRSFQPTGVRVGRYSIHGVFVEVFYMGYQGGQVPVDKAFANSAFYKLWLMKELFRFASETAVKVIKLQTKPVDSFVFSVCINNSVTQVAKLEA